MAFDLKSWLTGFSMGLAGLPCLLPNGEPTQPDEPVAPPAEPVAYLYNGVRLPKLPDWDMEKFPYAFIIDDSVYGYTFMATSAPPKHNLDDDTGMVTHDQFLCFGLRLYYRHKDGIWVFTAGEEDGIDYYMATSRLSPCIWANTDLIKQDGSVYLTASEPVPVYE